MSEALWLIPALPLAAAVLTAFLGPLLGQKSHWPCILAAAGSFVLSLLVLQAVVGGEQDVVKYFVWFAAGDAQIDASYVRIDFVLRADGLTAMMLVMVTFIGSLIAISSVGYMHGDPGYPRFFAEIALFLASMTGLVLASNYLVLFVFWEGVGLCSYLLIGFWFTKPSAAAAARKAFLVTRLGDVGLFVGLLLLWAALPAPSLDYQEVFDAAPSADPGLLTAACLLLFCGAAGKSAQFPLHVWLPDAMEGPSPVSALIHAATMVTAGVYLVARSTPLFALAPAAQLVVACIGGFTALLAALIALTQTDLKRVLAYSTVSQLGYMFLALGCGLKADLLVPLAVTAALFHLFTHAFFKALLFLSAGSVMHAMGNVIDMRRFGGLRRLLPTTHWTFLCGAAALAGVPLLSGFWSKDEILAVTLGASGGTSSAWWVYMVLFGVALITAGLTAFYTFRAYFLTFWGEERVPHEAGHHAHESPPVMLWPLMILAVGAVGVGLVVGPTHVFGDFLYEQWIKMLGAALAAQAEHHLNLPLMVGSSAFALGGIALAWWMYVRQPGLADKVEEAVPGAYDLSRNKFYLDELYYAFFVAPLTVFSVICRVLDQYVVDGLVDLFGQVPRLLGALFRPVQNGLVQFYALYMVLGLTVFLVALLLR
jgi:proton-translocating NADH-quinone oxidoreductase chain L